MIFFISITESYTRFPVIVKFNYSMEAADDRWYKVLGVIKVDGGFEK